MSKPARDRAPIRKANSVSKMIDRAPTRKAIEEDHRHINDGEALTSGTMLSAPSDTGSMPAIPFDPIRYLKVLLWQDDNGVAQLTVYDHGVETRTITFKTVEHARRVAASLAHGERVEMDDRIEP